MEEKVRLEELKRRQEQSGETDESKYKLELEQMKRKQEKMMKEMEEIPVPPFF